MHAHYSLMAGKTYHLKPAVCINKVVVQFAVMLHVIGCDRLPLLLPPKKALWYTGCPQLAQLELWLGPVLMPPACLHISH